MSRQYKGGTGWLLLAGYIAAWDYWACTRGHETLSGAYGRAMAHKVGRIPAALITVALVKHLVLPSWHPELDPFNAIAESWRNSSNIYTIIDALEEAMA